MDITLKLLLTRILFSVLLFHTEVLPLVNQKSKDEQTSKIMFTSR